MADFQQELQNRQITWNRFIRSSLWAAGIVAIIMLLLWIFLV
ncbi:MAG: aa3-type cytochrome c oxidase subunit IV [Alphaproteobacteria bacterium]